MAGLATLSKAAVVGILVAIRALAEGKPGISGLIIRTWRVALGAHNLSVQAGQGIARLRMIELGLTGLVDTDRLPVFEVMALLACRSEASIVRILVARGAGRGQT